MSDNKTIKVNNDFLTTTSSATKLKTQSKKTPVKKPYPSAKKIRKDFFKKIKEFQQKRNDTEVSKEKDQQLPAEDNDFESEFNKSLRFLQNVSTSKNPHNTSQKSCDSIHSELSDFDKESSEVINTPVIRDKLILPPRPPYSTIKGSSRPTYREWVKTQKRTTCSKPSTHTRILIENKPVKEESVRSQKIEEYKQQHAIPTQAYRKPITIKRKLGKIGKSVSVLIKSRTLRNHIQRDKQKLNQTSINDIKKYLRSRNIIKTGSTCPTDVLRKMYEQCILTGNVHNKSTENLIHNYVNDK
jgi:hypothetical protein